MRIEIANGQTLQVDVKFTHFTAGYGIGLKYQAEATCEISMITDLHPVGRMLSISSVRFKRNEKFVKQVAHRRVVAEALSKVATSRKERIAFWQAYWGGKFDAAIRAKKNRRIKLAEKHNTASNKILKQLMRA